MVRLAGWLAVPKRRDVLAHRVADAAQRRGHAASKRTGATVTATPALLSASARRRSPDRTAP